MSEHRLSDRRTLASTILVGCLSFGALVASAIAALPAEQNHNGIAYVTGGVGKDESDSIKSAMKDFQLVLTFASPQGDRNAYMADVNVAIEDKSGGEVFTAKADGPYMLVKLPAGTYTVKASAAGQTKTQQVNIGSSGSQRATFEWKQ